eukprot:TRINITY_DN4670_c0_g3_i4.p1 TRINITY_DN4670_c0_g3~~TRINITY_DN4670_c0_g3_i4.p1  ORF type:complete len:263 (+),score=35.67 TRINITY_DN4670_c0_g3_i4:96-884(+)
MELAGPEQPGWRKKKKHIFLLSSAGKPIYSRWGDADKLAGIMGVIVGIISFVNDNDDCIKSVIFGKHKIVFYLQGPIYCAMVAETQESPTQLVKQLSYMHSQIISILTITAHKLLKDKPQFDLRNLLGGTDRYLSQLASNLNRKGFPFLLNSIHCLNMPSYTRTMVGNILHSEREGNDLFYAMMIADGKLVHLVGPKKHILYPPGDVFVMFRNLHTSSALSKLRSLPLPLPFITTLSSRPPSSSLLSLCHPTDVLLPKTCTF